MFFAEGEEKKFPENLRRELNRLDIRYQLICYFDDKKKNINRKIIDYTIDSLNLSLEYYNKVNKRIKDLITEAVGNIPLTFDLDELKVNKKVEETIDPLIDIIDAHACKEINREELIRDVLKKLQKLRKEFKWEKFQKIKIESPFFSEKKYPRPQSFLKKKFKKCEEEFYNFLKSYKERKNIDKKTINLYTNLLNLYLETKHPYFLEFINKLPVILIGMKIRLDRRIEDIIFEQIYRNESNLRESINQKLKKLQILKKEYK